VIWSGAVDSDCVGDGLALYEHLSDGEYSELLVYPVEERRDVYIGVLVLVCYLATHLATWDRPRPNLSAISAESDEGLYWTIPFDSIELSILAITASAQPDQTLQLHAECWPLDIGQLSPAIPLWCSRKLLVLFLASWSYGGPPQPDP
jgi:hypothetical protein